MSCCGVCQRPLSIIIAVFSWCKRHLKTVERFLLFHLNRNRRLHLSLSDNEIERKRRGFDNNSHSVPLLSNTHKEIVVEVVVLVGSY